MVRSKRLLSIADSLAASVAAAVCTTQRVPAVPPVTPQAQHRARRSQLITSTFGLSSNTQPGPGTHLVLEAFVLRAVAAAAVGGSPRSSIFMCRLRMASTSRALTSSKNLCKALVGVSVAENVPQLSAVQHFNEGLTHTRCQALPEISRMGTVVPPEI